MPRGVSRPSSCRVRSDSASGPTTCPRRISYPRTRLTGPISRSRRGPSDRPSPHPGSGGRRRSGGKCIDEAGKPAAGVSVEGSWTSAEYGRNPNSIRAETDARGEFVLGNIAPKAQVKVSASSGIGRRVGVGHRPHGRRGGADHAPAPQAADPGPLRPGARRRRPAAGRRRGPGQGPPAQPADELGWRIRVRRLGGGPHRARWPIPDAGPAPHRVRVSRRGGGAGYEPAESSWVVAPALAVPDLRLRRSVGSARWPVASSTRPASRSPGPRCSSRAMARRRPGARPTPTAGSGSPASPMRRRSSSSSKEGYHFLGRRVDPKDRSVEFALRRLDEPPAAPLRSAAAPVPRDEERTIARALIAEAQKAPGTAP